MPSEDLSRYHVPYHLRLDRLITLCPRATVLFKTLKVEIEPCRIVYLAFFGNICALALYLTDEVENILVDSPWCIEVACKSLR